MPEDRSHWLTLPTCLSRNIKGMLSPSLCSRAWEDRYSDRLSVSPPPMRPTTCNLTSPAGGFQAAFLSWRWNFWLQLIFGGAVQILHWFTPETKTSILMKRIAKKKRAAGETHLYAAEELKDKPTLKEIVTTMARPFIMFATEPIVLCLSLLSGFSDALIFTFLEAYGPVFGQSDWHFGTIEVGKYHANRLICGI